MGLPRRPPSAASPADHPLTSAAPAGDLPPAPAGAARWRAVVASANADATADAAFALARLGVAVVTVRDGDEFTAALHPQPPHGPPHLAVASPGLPRLSGRALVHRVRTAPGARHAGLILLTEPGEAPPPAPAGHAPDAVLCYPRDAARLAEVAGRVAADVAARWPPASARWGAGPVAGDDEAVTVHVGEVPVHLTNRERAILRALASHLDGLDDVELQTAVWGAPQPPGFRGLIAELSRLRLKLVVHGVMVGRVGRRHVLWWDAAG